MLSLTAGCDLPRGILNNSTLQAQQCLANITPLDGLPCILCPNTDVSGIGVRAAFYVQSFFNTLVVILSPEDAVPSAWASALLTAALVIAAFVLKAQKAITLHHATLVLNYATISCISSLATAPLLPVWRVHPRTFYARRLRRQSRYDAFDRDTLLESDVYFNAHKHKSRREQNKQRFIISLALLTQVVLQWTWGVLLFVSPVYSQTTCSGSTNVIFFFFKFTAQQINDDHVYIWALWLFFCLGVTLYLAVSLAVFSGSKSYRLSRRPTLSSISGSPSVHTPVYRQLYDVATGAIPPWGDVRGQIFLWGSVVSVCLWSSYIMLSELQIHSNCIFWGENDFGGFGQVTSAFLALTPIWTIIVALYRWPRELRRARREGQRAQQSGAQSPLTPLEDFSEPQAEADSPVMFLSPMHREHEPPLTMRRHGGIPDSPVDVAVRSRSRSRHRTEESVELDIPPSSHTADR